MPGYVAVRNHTNCVDLPNLGKTQRDQDLGKIEFFTACSSTDLICDEGRRTAAVGGLPSCQ